MNEMEEEAEETNTQLSQAIGDLKKCRQEVSDLKAQLLQAHTHKAEGFSLQSLPLGEFANSVKRFQEKRNGGNDDDDNGENREQIMNEKKEMNENDARCQQLEQANYMLEQVRW